METCRTDLKIDEPAKGELSWSELLAAYRSERSQVSAAALLVRLGPWLTNARKALLAAPPFADADDIAQQLSLEVLAKAARWVPRCEDQWIPRRLAEEAERRAHGRSAWAGAPAPAPLQPARPLGPGRGDQPSRG